MKAAYLLNNHIIFDSTRSELHVNQQVIVLQELENTLLTLFVSNPEEIISKEALFTAGWKGRYASDNSLNRVISTLRTKLGDNSKSPEFIKTIPKKGYSFIAPLTTTEIADSEPQEDNSESDSTKEQLNTIHLKRIIKPATFLIVLAIFVTIASTSFLPTSVNPTTKISRITSITTLEGNEILPAISPSGQYIAFSHQNSSNNFYRLLVKPLHGPSKQLVASEKFHALNPAWESGSKALLYLRSGPGVCEIRKAGINLQLELISDILLTRCNTRSGLSSVSWGADDETIYFTDSTDGSYHQSIYQYKLRSGKKTRIASSSDKKSGAGFYYVTYNKTNNQLIGLSTKNQRETTISVFDANHNLVTKRLVKKDLKQVTPFNSKVAFLTQNNQLNALDAKSGKETVLMPPQATGIKYPFFNEVGQTQLAFVSGNLRKQHLLKRGSDGVINRVTAQFTTVESAPTLDRESNLYFLSNRSGITQVWKKPKDKPASQVTQFTQSTPVYSLTISPDGKFLALDTQEGVQIYNLHTISYQPTPLITLSGASTPVFNISSLLLVTKHLNGTNVLLPYDLKKEEYSDALVSDVVFGFSPPNTQKTFFTKRSIGGLWMLDGTNVTKVYDSAEITNANTLQFTSDGFIFADKYHVLHHYELSSGLVKTLVSIGPNEHFTYDTNTQELIFTQTSLGNTNIHLAELHR